ncbi:MAG: prolipoprotein diacylglyceryl transferase family protein, partial [Planctomycetota bacterium]
ADPSVDPPRVVVGAVRLDPPPAGLVAGAELVAINSVAIESLDQAQAWMLQAYQNRLPVRLRLATGETVDLPAPEPRERSLPVHPTQVYSAVNAGLLGWFLWSYYPHRRRDGEVIGLGLTIYPVSRFLIEAIRVDESAVLQTGLTISQNVSVLIFVAMAFYWAWIVRAPRGRAFRAEAFDAA